MRLITKNDYEGKHPDFLWGKIAFYQSAKSANGTVFYFDNFPGKWMIVFYYCVLSALLVFLLAFALKYGFPLYAVIPPGVLVVLIVFGVSNANKEKFKHASIEVTSGSCVIKFQKQSICIDPLLNILVFERAVNRSGYSVGEIRDVELCLVTIGSSGDELLFPLAENGLAECLAMDLAAGCGVPMLKEIVR
jgi:hypothetical protein